MPGLEESVSRVNPNALTAGADLVQPIKPVVDTAAVDALSRAIRAGQVSTDDFIQRYGELAQAKKIAGVQGLHEFISPEAIESRRAQTKTEGAKATAEGGLIPDQSKLNALELKMKHAELLNPAVKAFTEYAPLFGQKTPLNADGSPNVDEMARLGSAMKKKIFEQQATIAAGTPTTMEKVNDTVVPIGRFGGPVSQQQQAAARQAAYSVPSLEEAIGPKPGAMNAPAMPETQHFGVGDEGLVSPKGAASAPAAPAMAPGAPAAESAPRVIQNPDGSFTVPAAKAAMSQDQKTKLQNEAASVSEIELALRNAMGAVERGNVVGPAAGSAPVKMASNFITIMTGLKAQDYSDRRAIEQLIANKVLDKSSLLRPVSDKDLQFLQAGVPSMQDTPERWKQFNEVWQRTIENTKKSLSKDLGVPADQLFSKIPEQESATAAAPAATPAAAAASPVKNVNGVLWRRNPDGTYENLGPAK